MLNAKCSIGIVDVCRLLCVRVMYVCERSSVVDDYEQVVIAGSAVIKGNCINDWSLAINTRFTQGCN